MTFRDLCRLGILTDGLPPPRGIRRPALFRQRVPLPFASCFCDVVRRFRVAHVVVKQVVEQLLKGEMMEILVASFRHRDGQTSRSSMPRSADARGPPARDPSDLGVFETGAGVDLHPTLPERQEFHRRSRFVSIAA